MATPSAAFVLEDSDPTNEPQRTPPSNDETRPAYAGRARIKDVESKLGALLVDNRLKICSEGLICDRFDPKAYPAPCREQ
jgi:hypothetical protein